MTFFVILLVVAHGLPLAIYLWGTLSARRIAKQEWANRMEQIRAEVERRGPVETWDYPFELPAKPIEL